MITINENDLRKLEKYYNLSRKKFTDLSEFVQESTDSIRTTKAYVGEQKQYNEFLNKNTDLKNTNFKVIKNETLLSVYTNLGIGLGTGLSILYGSNLVLNNVISLGDFVAFNGYMLLLQSPIMWIPWILKHIKKVKVSYDRLDKMFKLKEEEISIDNISNTEKLNGNIEIKNSSVKSYDIGIDGYVVSNGEVKKVSTTKSFKNGTAVYYNPVYGEKCNDYTEANSKTGTKSGCMKWYVFNDKEGNATVNVILDHNTTANVAWNSTGNNSEMKEVKKALENDTKNWKNTARLITANEVAKITKHPTFDATQTGQGWFCLDTNQPDNTNWCSKAQGKSEYAWLFDYTYGCTRCGCNTSDSNTEGYWTSTQYKDNSTHAWIIYRDSNIGINDVNHSSQIGIRPVITIAKSAVS